MFAHAFPTPAKPVYWAWIGRMIEPLWRYAAENEFCIVTLDSDFADLSALMGAPPKVVWLKCGNRSTAYVEGLLRTHTLRILTMAVAEDEDLIEIA